MTPADLPEASSRAIDRLAYSYDDYFDRVAVEALYCDSYSSLAAAATVTQFLPLLAERFTRERLEARTQVDGRRVKRVPEVVFVCVRNAGRSQIAAALARRYAGAHLHIRTGGSQPDAEIHPEVRASLAEVGLSLDEEFPKPLTNDFLAAADVVITMGCGDVCPPASTRTTEDWQIADPAGQSPERVNAIRDEIDQRVRALVTQLLPDLALPKDPTRV